MDYEKKYNEALEWMREMYPCLTDSLREDAEHYFPELRESEDEETRQFLINWINQNGIGTLHYIDISWKERCIAYLEKQKEQKPAEWSDTNELVFKDICKHLKEEGYNGWIVLLNVLRNGEFQPKQELGKEDEK